MNEAFTKSYETMHAVDKALGFAANAEASLVPQEKQEKQEYTYYIQSAIYRNLSASLTISLIRAKKSVESLTTPCNFSLETNLCVEGKAQRIVAFSPTEHADIQRHYNSALVVFNLHTLVEEGDKQTLQKVDVCQVEHGLTLRSKDFLGFTTMVEPDRSENDPVRDSLFSRNAFKAVVKNGRLQVSIVSLAMEDAYVFAKGLPMLAFDPANVGMHEAKDLYCTLFKLAGNAELFYHAPEYETL